MSARKIFNFTGTLSKARVLGLFCPWLLGSIAFAFESKLAVPFQQLRSSQDSQSRDLAIRAIAGKLEKNGYKQMDIREELPVLLDALKDGNDYVELKAAKVLAALATFRPDSREVLHEAIPSMTAHLNRTNPEWRQTVVGFMGLVEPHPSDALIGSMLNVLKDEDWTSRAVAIQSLAKLKPLPKPVLDALIAKMKDSSDRRALEQVIQEFGRNQVSDPRAIQEITVALDGTDVYAQRTAAMSLAQIGPPASSAIPALVRLVNDPRTDKMARENARAALKRIQGK